jgi:ATP-dependent Lhr-like helicase
MHELKDKLPHTWEALFARFGRFTEIQALAVEPLLAGKNCILISATASGKTEAALAPILERHKQYSIRNSASGLHRPLSRHRTSYSRRRTPDTEHRTPEGPGIIYVVPTRALTRDLARRLEQPLDQLAVRMQVKTGDESALNHNRLPEFLLTTPESLDSLLANSPRVLKDARAVILDEIHLYDNTVRGDQLRILLNRMRRIKRYALSRGDIQSDQLQFCALSATVSDPQNVAARYFADPVVIKTGGRREVDAELMAMEGTESLRLLFADLQRRAVKKVLAFCNRRADCEELAHLFQHTSPFGNRVFVHHASLDARIRRHVEKEFSMADAALCFATSTLELGIDIGDVDLIVLIGPPENTSAFLQRIGRGNRRTSRASVVCFYRTPMERAIFHAFTRAAESGEIESNHYFFRPSVVVQQLCSYIKQTRLGEIDPDSAYELFASPEGAALVAKSLYDQIIEHMISKGYFAPARGNSLRPGPKWEELYQQRAIYTNLTDTSRGSVEVVDEMTGRKLGDIDSRAFRETTFLFSGQARQATKLKGRKLIVRPAEGEAEASAPRFRTPWRPLTHKLAKAIAAELSVPRASSASEIPMIVERDVTPTEGQSVTMPAPPERAWIFHCAGDAYGLVLGDLLEASYGAKLQEYSGLYLVMEGRLPPEPLSFNVEQVRAQVRRRWNQFESWFALGRFQRELPLRVRRESVIDAFNVEEFLRTFSGHTVIEVNIV